MDCAQRNKRRQIHGVYSSEAEEALNRAVTAAETASSAPSVSVAPPASVAASAEAAESMEGTPRRSVRLQAAGTTPSLNLSRPCYCCRCLRLLLCLYSAEKPTWAACDSCCYKPKSGLDSVLHKLKCDFGIKDDDARDCDDGEYDESDDDVDGDDGDAEDAAASNSKARNKKAPTGARLTHSYHDC